MRSTILLFAIFGAAWAFPEGAEELQFKRLYVDPVETNTIDDIGPRIVNGEEAVPHSIPSSAYIIVTGIDGSRWLCGGSLISPKFVLTAAHCVDASVSAQVYLGAHNVQIIEKTRILVTSTKLIAHEEYDLASISYDIGLIEFPSPVELNEYVNVIPLPKRGVGSYEGEYGTVSGWGLTTGGGTTSATLRKVSNYILSNPTCHSFFSIVIDSQICMSGSGSVGSCNGDSGGPLVVDGVQVGVVSYGVKGCKAGYPSAFSRVSYFLDWIEKHTDLKF